MEDLRVVFGVLGNITAFLVIISPIGTFWKIARSRSVEEVKSLPYVCMLLNCSLWAYYGICKSNEWLLVTVNGLGVVVGIVYVSIYITFAQPEKKARIACTVLVSYGVCIALFALMRAALKMKVEAQIGLFCAVFALISYASPLSAAMSVVRNNSVECMPFLLSFSLFINGIVWTVYAVLLADYFIGVPNGIGTLLGAAQLVLYFVYRRQTSEALRSGDLEDNLIVA